MRKTRYSELGYDNFGPGLWRIINVETGSETGQHYKTKAELLADLDRFAAEFGCSGAKPSWGELVESLEIITAWATMSGEVDGNPYCKLEVKQALQVLARVRGLSSPYDVTFERPVQ